MAIATTVRCPHCHMPMARWANPQSSTWNSEFQFVCFNDDCPYFVRGWKWMLDHFNVQASYRQRIDPATGEAGPLAVWSYDALRGGIIVDTPGEDLHVN